MAAGFRLRADPAGRATAGCSMNQLHHRQLRLLPRAVPATHRRLCRRRLGNLRPLLRGLREKTPLHLRQLLARSLKLQLQSPRLGMPAQGGDLAHQLLHPPVQAIIFFLEQNGKASKGVRILNRIERSHNKAYFTGSNALLQVLCAKKAAE